MSGPSSVTPGATVLHLWERAADAPPFERALLLAAGSADDPLGELNARMLRLRAETFGGNLNATTTCPQCTATVEFELNVQPLLDEPDRAARHPVQRDGTRVVWRSPSLADMAAAAHADGNEEVLLRRCVLEARDADGAWIEPTELPSAVRAALAQAMERADPLAEVIVNVTCAACGARFRCDVDVAEFVWAEVEARAKQVLLDVDILARAYGWTEADVLALSETRRAAYLRIVSDGMP
jgi:hypothetical protein